MRANTVPGPSPTTDVVPIRLRFVPSSPTPEHVVAHVSVLAGLSDLYVLDAPLSLHGLSYGIPAIGDRTKTPTVPDVLFLLSINHTVYFHGCQDFKSDDLLQIEITSPWAEKGRVFAESRIFHEQSKSLLATCIQEVRCPSTVGICLYLLTVNSRDWCS
jgi:acyl-CoA thioesterase